MFNLVSQSLQWDTYKQHNNSSSDSVVVRSLSNGPKTIRVLWKPAVSHRECSDPGEYVAVIMSRPGAQRLPVVKQNKNFHSWSMPAVN